MIQDVRSLPYLCMILKSHEYSPSSFLLYDYNGGKYYLVIRLESKKISNTYLYSGGPDLGEAYHMTVFGICQFLGGDLNKNGRYSVFQSLNGDGKILFLVENTTVTVFIQKFDYSITVIFDKINVNTVI